MSDAPVPTGPARRPGPGANTRHWAVAAIFALIAALLGVAASLPALLTAVVAVLVLVAARLLVRMAARPVELAEPATAQQDWQRVNSLVADALDLPPSERAAFVARVADEAPALRAEIESLLAAHDRHGLVDRDLADWMEPAQAGGDRIGETVGPYRIQARLGGGGMGVVYRARDRRLERDIAIKFLPAHLVLDDAAKERFVVEAQAAAALDHPNICTVHEIVDTPGGELFIAMAFYDGETIEARIAREPVDPAEAVDLVTQAARGLAKAHERGIVHRDIKPANLIVTRDGILKIVDFGIAKLADVSITRTGGIYGTIAYMSPEQALGERVDGRSDLWSLGVVLYEMLTGRRPFRGSSHPLMLQAIATQAVPPLDLPSDSAAESLERIIGRLLAKQPGQRYANASELIRDLERHQRERERRALPLSTEPAADPATGGEMLPADGERRPATVVVAQVSGFAGLVERLVPEQLDRVSARIRAAAAEIAKRHGGVLNQFREDELVLLFGVPVTREDHAVRAVRSALELHEWVRALRQSGPGGNPDIQLHTGIDTGLLVTRPRGASGVTYHVTGESLNVARSLAAHASASEAWITPDCHRFVGPFFDTEPRPPVPLRARAGGTTPRRVIRHSGHQSRLEAAVRAGLTAYVGRENELERLEGRLEAAVAGSGRVVVVTGEAGLGKSRLVYEFTERCVRGRARILSGRCQAADGKSAYLPIAELLRACFGLSEDDRSATAVACVIAGARAVSDALDEFIPIFLHLLSIESTAHPIPEHLRGDHFRVAIQQAIAALITLAARQRPTVLLLEDWHWVDDASHAVIEQVAELTPQHPLLVIATSRGPIELSGAAVHDVIALEPLGAGATGAMLQSLAGVDAAPESIATVVHERTGGNPFFIEEICHTLLEDGTLEVDDGTLVLTGSIDALQLPDTVEAVIRTRLDRLEPDSREVIRLASVVGREFSRGILERALPRIGRLPNALQSLKAAGLVHQVRVVPDALFRFKHVLTQHVAYGSLLEHQRRDLHGRVAEAIEHVYDNRINDHLQSLAFHYSRAERWVQAVDCGMRAADRLHALNDFAEARQLLEQCEQWLGHAPATERTRRLVRVLLKQERVCETLGLRSRQQELIERVLTILEKSDDDVNLAEAYLRQGDLFTLLRDFDRAEVALDRSLELRRQLGDEVGERNTLRSLGLMHWHHGRLDAALDAIHAALALDRRRAHAAGVAGDLVNLGAVLKGCGDLEGARRVLEEALELSQRELAADPDLAGGVKLPYILHNLANVYRELGDTERALELLKRSVRLMKDKHLPIQTSYHHTAIAHIRLQQGRIDESLEHYRSAVEEARRGQHSPGLAQALAPYGEILFGVGRVAEAIPCLQEAGELFEQLKDDAGAAQMRATLATAHMRQGDYDRARADAQRAANVYRRLGNAGKEMGALETLARAVRQAGAGEVESRDHYEAALVIANRIGDRAAEARLRNSLGIVAWSAGDFERALSEYRQALTIFRALGDDAAVSLTLNSIGFSLLRLGRYAEAESTLAHAVAQHQSTDNTLLEAHARTGLGEAFQSTNRLDDARMQYQASFELRQAAGDLAGAGWALYRLARLAARAGNSGAAKGLAERALEIAIQCGDLDLRHACSSMTVPS